MRIHRTAPTHAFSVFSDALVRDRSISWCAVGVLTYLLRLSNRARATIRTHAEQRKEGRARIADALRELEESRQLRRVVRRDGGVGQLLTVYEAFDTLYGIEPLAGEPQKVENLAESAAAAPVTTVEIRTVDFRKSGASAYREAARRGGALARVLLSGRPKPA